MNRPVQSLVAGGASVFMASVACLTGIPVLAQQQEAGDALEEVIVTARKRDESLLEIPLAISAFSAEQLESIGAANMVELSKFTAGLQFNEQGAAEPGRIYTAIRFRGLSTELKQPFAQLGSAFLDGVYMAGGVSSYGTENYERIEVVKGPSSAWLGRSTFAGAINFISKLPSLTEFSGRVTTKFAQDETFDVTFAHEGPIVADRLAYRIYLRGYDTGGQYTASDGGAMGEESTDTVIGTLHAKPSDALTLTLRAIVSEDNDGPPAQAFMSGPLGRRGNDIGVTNCFAQGITSPDMFRRNDPARGNLTDFICGEIPNRIDLVDSTTIVPQAALDLWQTVLEPFPGAAALSAVGLVREQERYQLHADYDIVGSGLFADSSLSFLAAYNDENVTYIRDSDQTEVPNWLSRDPQRHESTQIEFRLTSSPDDAFTWQLGVSWFDASFKAQYATGESVLGTDGALTCGTTSDPFNPRRDVDTALGDPNADGISPCYSPPLSNGPDNDAETLGIFGQLGYRFTDRWSADLEWRWQQEDILVTLFNVEDLSAFPEQVQAFGTGKGAELGRDFDTFLPRFTLQYRPGDDTNLWATFSRGNNPGFFNGDIVNRPADDLDIIFATVDTDVFIDEEELDNFEIGLRQRAWGNRVNFSLVAYNMTWKNQKTRTSSISERPDGSQIAASLVVSGFNTDLYGIEFEGTMNVSDKLTLEAMLNWADAEYDNFECGFTDDYSPADADGRLVCDGNRPVQFPEWSGALAATWNDRLSENWDYFVRLDGTYTGKRYADEANFAYLGAQTLLNLRAGFSNERLRFEAFVTNLTADETWLGAGRWSDFSADRGTRNPFEFGLQQGVSLSAPRLRQAGIRIAYDF